MKKTRIEKEKQTVAFMIRLYCSKKEHHKELCPECSHLLDYARARLDTCVFGERKTSCKQCPFPCYRRDMREKMRQIMRYSGPRMIFYSPLQGLKHFFHRALPRKCPPGKETVPKRKKEKGFPNKENNP